MIMMVMAVATIMTLTVVPAAIAPQKEAED